MKNFIRNYYPTVLLLLGLFAFRSSFADQYSVPTGSMEPTILPGDRIVVSKMSFDLHLPFSDFKLMKTGEPRRGDIIVFRYPPNPSVNYVKRLVGLPGDRLKIVDGILEINGKPIKLEGVTPKRVETLLHESPAPFLYQEDLNKNQSHLVQRIPDLFQARAQELTVPAGYYFFMGDNRDNSSDSRVWGFVPRKNIEGRAFGIIASIDWASQWFPKFRSDRFFKAL